MAESIITKKSDIVRIKVHINGLDEQLENGIPSGHITLISGAAGTMKSSVCFNILYHEALINKRNGLYLSLEQSHSSIINHMINMDYDLTKINLIVINNLADIGQHIKKINQTNMGSLILVDVGCIRKEIKDLSNNENKSWLNVVKNILKKIKLESKLDLFVLDSLSALYVLSKFENPRIELFFLFEFLRDLNLTSYLITEASGEGKNKYGEYDEDFLSDGIIFINLNSYRRKQIREISIVKMRTTKCNHDIFSLEYREGKFHAEYGGQNPLL
ncbi:MAG: RAD55 family ATPase [Candidatus Woesearchaeota archaeon]